MPNCLNCSQELIGNYCHKCGQKGTLHRYSFKLFFKDFFSSVAELDSDLIRTVKSLLINPGKFVRDYLMGKRKNYISALKFLIIVLALNAAVIFIFNRPAVEPVKITGNENKFFLNQLVNILTIAAFVIFMFPVAGGIKIINRKKNYSFMEYYIFLLYMLSQSILIFIIILLCLHFLFGGFSEAVRIAIWLTLFTGYYFRGYITFFKDDKNKIIKSIGSYFLGIAILLCGLAATGLVLKFFIG